MGDGPDIPEHPQERTEEDCKDAITRDGECEYARARGCIQRQDQPQKGRYHKRKDTRYQQPAACDGQRARLARPEPVAPGETIKAPGDTEERARKSKSWQKAQRSGKDQLYR